MKTIVADPELVAYCGLYCGACRAYLQDRCPGCRENEKAGWCKVRACCRENERLSCADCGEFPEPCDCRRFNNFISKVFGVLFRSDRAACIRQIQEVGVKGHAQRMAEQGRQTIKR